MKKLCASILGVDNKKTLVNELIKKGIGMIHYDSMDGKFVPATSLPTNEMIQIIENTDEHIIDIHLMVEKPLQEIVLLENKFDFITFHFEATGIVEANRIFDTCKGSIGIAINPDTNIEDIFPLLSRVSHVLVMSVFPGKGGQTFIPETINKIKKMQEVIKKENLNVLIQVDGGINYQWANKAYNAGADSLVSGSFLINNIDNKDFFKNIQKKN